MSAAQLLHELRTLGVRVWPDAGALRFKAPADAMTPALTARLKAAKPELLSILAAGASANDDGHAAPDLPLLAAVNEYHALIDRLTCSEDQRCAYHAMANRWSAEHILGDLPSLRTLAALPGRAKVNLVERN